MPMPCVKSLEKRVFLFFCFLFSPRRVRETSVGPHADTCVILFMTAEANGVYATQWFQLALPCVHLWV